MSLLLAGLPEQVPGVTVNRLCASGLEAAVQASRAIRLGDMDLCIAGGVESMTRAPWAVMKPTEAFAGGSLQSYDTSLGWRFPNPRMGQRFPLESMGETAENVAVKYRVPRGQQDEFALRSHQRALAAQEAGRYRAELLPVTVPGKQPVVVERDEGPRADTSLEKLAKLKAAFREGGTVTAGNSSSLNDGAAALLLASTRKAAELALKPLARIVSAASAGVDPREMGIGPVPATQKALKKAGLTAKQLDLVELNEAFAAQSLAVIQELGLDPERVNVDGGAIAIGHPLGMSGARILGHLAHALKARGGRYGLATLCVGVGQGVSVVIESV
jgi:acetyl-CoA acetyltransferase family protein